MMQTHTALVAIVVCCPKCKNTIEGGKSDIGWSLKRVRQVGMFKVFDCPYCFTALQLPLALFTLYIEDESNART